MLREQRLFAGSAGVPGDDDGGGGSDGDGLEETVDAETGMEFMGEMNLGVLWPVAVLEANNKPKPSKPEIVKLKFGKKYVSG